MFFNIFIKSNLLSLDPPYVCHGRNFYKSILIPFKYSILICMSNEFLYAIFHHLWLANFKLGKPVSPQEIID